MQKKVLSVLTSKIKEKYPSVVADEHNMQVVLHSEKKKLVGLTLRLLGVRRHNISNPVVFNLWINGGCKNGKLEFREWLSERLSDWYFCDDGIVDFEPPKDRNPDYGNAVQFYPGCSWVPESKLDAEKIMMAYERLDKKLREIGAYDFEPQGKVSSGVDSEVQTVMPKEEIAMKAIPEVSYRDDEVDTSSVDDNVLYWVTSVEDLFNRKPIVLSDERKIRPGKYVIPAYQRKYAWESRQIGQLCRDLLHSANSRPDSAYHLGTLIFHRDTGKDFFYVVDGQQRLTTISELLRQQLFYMSPDAVAEKMCERQFSDKDARRINAEFLRYVEEDRNKILSALNKSTFVCIAVADITEAFQLFSTQNGRGRPLSPINLLKAFHFHEVEKLRGSSLEIDEDRCKSLDKEWEELEREKAGLDGKLLSQVVGEHLYRLRNWCRGEFPEKGFSNAKIDEFKGLTVDFATGAKIPLQNFSVLRHPFSRGEKGIEACLLAERDKEDGMNCFVSIDQPMINGEDFFEYAISYAKAYKLLFSNCSGMEEFKKFYRDKCCRYPGAGRRGDTYARHIFESLCLFCFDRFGKAGLVNCMRELYCCAYYERLVKSRCYYATCGREFAIKAVRCMLRSMTLPDLKANYDAGITIRAFKTVFYGLFGGFLVMTGIQICGEAIYGQFVSAIQMSVGSWIYLGAMLLSGGILAILLDNGGRSSGEE